MRDFFKHVNKTNELKNDYLQTRQQYTDMQEAKKYGNNLLINVREGDMLIEQFRIRDDLMVEILALIEKQIVQRGKDLAEQINEIEKSLK